MLEQSVIPYAEQISESFGGLEVIQHLLTQQEMEYILTYPGFLIVLKSWNPTFDLQDFGYIVNTNYRIFNQDWEFVYEGRSETGIFGETTEEVQFLIDSPNASYLHIKFDTLEEPVCGLIWVCNALTPALVTKKINQLQDQKNAAQADYLQSEIFVDLSNLALGGVLKLFFLTRPWSSQVSLEDLLSDPKTEEIVQPASRVLVLYPKRSGWYAIVHDFMNTLSLVKLEQITGTNLRRIKVSNDDLLYIDFSNDNLNTPLINPNVFSSQDSSDSWLRSNQTFRINATANYSGRGADAIVMMSSEMIGPTGPELTSTFTMRSSMTFYPQPQSSSFYLINTEAIV